MTGKTHIAISAATVAVALAAAGAAGAQASGDFASLLPAWTETSYPAAPATAGLLLLGVVAGLFPDLDAPDTELQHLPRRAARRVRKYVRMGMPRRSPLGTLAQELARLVALPFSLLFAGAGAALRAVTGHRGFTHTLWGALAFTGLAAAAALLLTGSVHLALRVGAVWLLGYASHLAADACTPSGIPLFGDGGTGLSPRQGHSPSVRGVQLGSRPARPRRFHLLPRRMRIRTGGPADTAVRWVSWVVFGVAVTFMFAG